MDDHAVEILNELGQGEVVILCEHASNHIPAEFGGLGLAPGEHNGHAAWDPGARALSLRLAEALHAPAVASRVSRPVYDCNRPPDAPSAIPEKSERIIVPGNVGLDHEARVARIRMVYEPFCAAVARVLDARGPGVAVVTVHSFTPVHFGEPRAVELGILHDEDSRLADGMLARAGALPHRRVARNEPYGPDDGVTHSLKLHALSRGLANVMIEVRNDLLRGPGQIAGIAREILTLLEPALEEIKRREDGSW